MKADRKEREKLKNTEAEGIVVAHLQPRDIPTNKTPDPKIHHRPLKSKSPNSLIFPFPLSHSLFQFLRPPISAVVPAMAVINSSTHLALPPPLRSSFAFFSRIFLRPVSASGFPRRALVSVRAQAPGSDGFGSKQPLPVDQSGPSIGSSGSPSSSSVIDFLTLCHSLKTTKRKGWINHGINGPESIADHMYRMALMSLIAGDLPGVNRERCIKIALVHDIAEAIVGDITPADGVPKEEKSRRESAALNEMCQLLGGGMRADEIKELWAEYENNSSLEANLVKDFDKVELILQAFEYEIEHGKVLDEFFHSTAGKFQTDVGKSWAAEVLSRRNSRLTNRQN